MPKSVTPAGVDGIFGQETQSVVRQFQSRNGLRVDGMVGQHTLDKLDELLLKLPPGPPVPPPLPPTPTPTHEQTIRDAFQRSREAIGFVLPQLRFLEMDINRADQLEDLAKVIAIQTLGRVHARNIAVLSKRLFVEDPLSTEFRAALRKVIELTEQNSRETSTIIDGGSTGRCDRNAANNKGRVPFAASTRNDPDPRVSVCDPFFPRLDDTPAERAARADLQRDVLTHEFFHLVGLADVEGTDTTAKALNNANTLAQIVAWIKDRNRQVNSDGHEPAIPPLPSP
jgi:hypothetical protein